MRKLIRKPARERAGAFLVEGAQAVREALIERVDVRELFITEQACERHSSIVERAVRADVPVRTVTERAAATLSETVTPQGLVAVCGLPGTSVSEALAGSPQLVAVLAGVADPGNAGTVVRVADAAGADAVLFAGDTVDPYNGKAVRSSTGSVFHLPVARDRDALAVLDECRRAGLRLVGADGAAEDDLDHAELSGALAGPVAWVFGSEAHGLNEQIVRELDKTLHVPIYGRAESLNLATAAAVCLYTSARSRLG